MTNIGKKNRVTILGYGEEKLDKVEFNTFKETINEKIAEATDSNEVIGSINSKVADLETLKIDKTTFDTFSTSVDQKVETVTSQLAERVKKVNGKIPDADGNVTVVVPEVDTTKLATKEYVTEEIVKVNTGGTIDISTKADKSEVELLKPRMKLSFQNVLSNTNFKNVSSWTPSGLNLAAENNTLKATSDGSSASPFVSQTYAFTVGKRYFAKARVRVTNPNCNTLVVRIDSINMQTSIQNPVENQWYDVVLSGVHASGTSLLFRHYYTDAATASDKTMEIQYVVVMDVTQQFEDYPSLTPTMIEGSLGLLTNSWFEGTKPLEVPDLNEKRVLTEYNGQTGYFPINDLFNTRYDYPSFVLFGDSITNANGAFNAKDGVTWKPEGYLAWTQLLANGHLRVLNNAGIGGDTTQMMLGRIRRDVLPYKSDFVFVMGGVNDAGSDTPPERTIENLNKIYDTVLANGSKLVIATATPNAVTNTPSRLAAMNTVNKWIKDYAYTHREVIFVDFWSCLVDSSGQYLRSDLSNDRTHPHALGAYRMGKQAFDAINAALRFSKETMLSNSLNDVNNLITNGVLLGDNAGKATSWSVTGGTTTKNYFDDGKTSYNEQVIETQTPAALSMMQDITVNIPVGKTIEGLVRIKLENMSQLEEVAMKIQYNEGTGLKALAYSITGDFKNIVIPEAVHTTPQVVIPAGTTTLRVYINAKNCIGKMKVSNPTIRILD